MAMRLSLQARESLTVKHTATADESFGAFAVVTISAPGAAEEVDVFSEHPAELRMIAAEFTKAADSLEKATDGH